MAETTDQIHSGLLVIGVSSTVLFDGETSTTELILLNLSTGVDFPLPISEDQASMLFEHLEASGQQPSSGHLVEVPQEFDAGEAHGEQGNPLGSKVASLGEVDPTPQF